MSFLRRKMHLSHRLLEDSEVTFQLPPGDYFIGESLFVMQQHYNEQLEMDYNFHCGLYTIKSPTPQYFVPTSLDVDGAYLGTNGHTYGGTPSMFSASLIRKNADPYHLEHDGQIQTFTEPVKVKVFGYGDNFGLHGIEISSGAFHLRIASDVKGVQTDASGKKTVTYLEFDYEKGWFKPEEEDEEEPEEEDEKGRFGYLEDGSEAKEEDLKKLQMMLFKNLCILTLSIKLPFLDPSCVFANTMTKQSLRNNIKMTRNSINYYKDMPMPDEKAIKKAMDLYMPK